MRLTRNNTRVIWFTFFFAVMMVFASVSVQADQRIRVPYAVSQPSEGWWCGVCVTNLTNEDIEDLYIDVCTPSGTYFNFKMGNYRTNIGPLGGFEMVLDVLENLYGTLPSEQVWFEVWHSGTQEFAISVFSGQTIAGVPHTLSFQSFFSESASHTFPNAAVIKPLTAP